MQNYTSELPFLRASMYTSLGTNNAIDAEIHDILSLVFTEENNLPLAFDEVNKALSFFKDDLGLLHRKVLILLELKQHGEARKLLDEIYHDLPDAKTHPEIAGLEGRLHRELYELYGDKSDLNKAILVYKGAYDENPSSYYCGVNVVSLELMAERPDNAKDMARIVLSFCEKIAENQVVSFWLDFTMGELNLILEDYTKALNFYSQGISKDPPPRRREKDSALKGIYRAFKFAKLDQSKLNAFENIMK